MSRPPSIGRRRFGLLTAGIALLSATSLLAAQLKLELKLIWATDDDKYHHPKHERVDPATTEKFRKIFKWKHYFIINRLTGVVPNRGTNSFRVSDKCVVEITELVGPKIELKLIGEGKPVVKTVKDLTKGESTTIGGDDKDGTGWFILISELDETAEKKAGTK